MNVQTFWGRHMEFTFKILDFIEFSVGIRHNENSHYGVLIEKESVEWISVEREEAEKRARTLYNGPSVDQQKNQRWKY